MDDRRRVRLRVVHGVGNATDTETGRAQSGTRRGVVAKHRVLLDLDSRGCTLFASRRRHCDIVVVYGLSDGRRSGPRDRSVDIVAAIRAGDNPVIPGTQTVMSVDWPSIAIGPWRPSDISWTPPGSVEPAATACSSRPPVQTGRACRINGRASVAGFSGVPTSSSVARSASEGARAGASARRHLVKFAAPKRPRIERNPA